MIKELRMQIRHKYGHKNLLRASRSVVYLLERPTVVVGRRLSRKSRIKEIIMNSLRHTIRFFFTALLAAVFALPAVAADAPKQLADPDGKPADMSKPVQVYILMGQSNMLGFGKIGAADKPGSLTHAVKEKNKYPYLVDDAGNWTERKDVRNVRVMGSGTGSMRVFNNEWMTIKGRNIGPEIGIGHYVGHVTDAPVLILKSCIGNRSLGWDLLPPGSKQFEQDGMIYAGYKDSPDKWKKGETPKPIGWYAGMQYDGDVANAKKVLAELDKYYPGAKKYEIAGFFWWQGDKDRYNAVHASRYEQNLVHLIKMLRKDFDAPNAKFVCATLGQTAKGAKGTEGQILEAQLAVDGKNGKYPEFKGNVATVYSKPLCHGGASNSHYGGNAETYMDIGEAMGRAMVELIETSDGSSRWTTSTGSPPRHSHPLAQGVAAKSKSYQLIPRWCIQPSLCDIVFDPPGVIVAANTNNELLQTK